MKKILFFFFLLLVSVSSFSQAPQGISYQAVVRYASNVLVVNSPISAFITIQKDSANGSLVYGEIDNATTNANGLFSVVIGKGQSQIGSLSNINWGNGVYYIRSAIDPAGGTNRTIIGSSQILSVPYALYAANGTASGNKVGDMQYWDGTKWTLIAAGNNGSVLTLCNGVPTWGGCGVVATLPTVSTSATSSIVSTGATLNGNVSADGGAAVTNRGFCYSSTNSTPTLANSTVSVGSGTGAFSTSITGLTANTLYYVTAFATNSVGTSYSTPTFFTTISNGLATITTTAASSITSNSAILGGSITSDGGIAIISRGICFSSTTTSPTLANNSVTIGNGTGSFSTLINILTANTTYYVAAYATNSLGVTTYGSPISFVTGGVVATLPTVSTSAASSIVSTGATLNGNVSADGGATVTTRGFCYSNANSNPTLANSTVIVGSGTGSFSTSISGLSSSTLYYVTAFATNSAGTSYSTPISFTTSGSGLAIITTSAASSITNNSALLGGNITSDGGNAIISRGVCYSSTTTNPTLANNSVSIGSGTGSFSSLITGLTASTTYYVVAYATNNQGITTYGTPINFVTGVVVGSLPSVSTSAANTISSTGATLNGNVTGDGGATVTGRGFCYSSNNTNPTLANSNVYVGSGTGSFSTSISGLSANTTYYVTAFATNSAGTSYGTPISFTTTSLGAIITTSPATSITSNSAVLGGSITSDGGNIIISSGVCYSSTNNSPTLANTSIVISSGVSTYSALISGLISGTTYYVVAYATNNLGITTYGTPISFVTSGGGIQLPNVTNTPAASLTSTTATLTGNVTADGGSTVISRGFCYSSNTATPTLVNSTVTVGNGIGNFSTTITGLLPNTLYYVTAYATNSNGTTYSTPITFTTSTTSSTFSVGQVYGGGIIFYVDNTGQHGLISSTSDQSASIQWYNGGYTVTGATGTGIGTGPTNTTNILSAQGSGSYAAYIASQTSNGYSDWYLPSLDELNLMYSNLFVKNLGNFVATFYWSSTEKNQNEAWVIDFAHNSSFGYWKNNKTYVRAIRKF